MGVLKAPIEATQLRRLPLANRVGVQHDLLGDLAKAIKDDRDKLRHAPSADVETRDSRFKGIAEGLFVLLVHAEAEPLHRQILRALALLSPAAVLPALPALASALCFVSTSEMARALEAVGRTCGQTAVVRGAMLSQVLPVVCSQLCEGMQQEEPFSHGQWRSTPVLCIQALISLLSAPEQPPAPPPPSLCPPLVAALSAVVSGEASSRDAVYAASLALCSLVCASASKDPSSASEGLEGLMDPSRPFPALLLPLMAPYDKVSLPPTSPSSLQGARAHTLPHHALTPRPHPFLSPSP